MARLAFFNLAAHGHVNPTLPLVAELVRRGEEVHYFVAPVFREAVEQAGAIHHDYQKSNHHRVHAYPSIAHLAAALLESSADAMPGVLDAIRTYRIDYIIHDCLATWGRFGADLTRVPAICSSGTLAMNASTANSVPKRVRLRALLRAAPALPRFARAAKRMRREFGLERLRLFDVVTNHQDLNIIYTSRAFQPRASEFDDRYCFVGPIGAPLKQSKDFPWDELGDAPVVYVSLGTLHNADAQFFKTCCVALADLPIKVVLSTGSAEMLSALGSTPRNFIARDFVPQFEVLGRSRLFVSRGGLNSISDSCWHGVPVVLLPRSVEHHIQTARVVELGAGLSLDETKVTPASLRAACERVLGDDAFRTASRRIGDSFRSAGGYEKAADAVFAWKARRGIAASPTH